MSLRFHCIPISVQHNHLTPCKSEFGKKRQLGKLKKTLTERFRWASNFLGKVQYKLCLTECRGKVEVHAGPVNFRGSLPLSEINVLPPMLHPATPGSAHVCVPHMCLLANCEETQASPHFRLVSMNFRAFVHCSSELNWILKRGKQNHSNEDFKNSINKRQNYKLPIYA